MMQDESTPKAEIHQKGMIKEFCTLNFKIPNDKLKRIRSTTRQTERCSSRKAGRFGKS